MPAKRGLVNHWRSSATSLSKSIVLSLPNAARRAGPEAGRRAAARRFLVHGAFRVPSQRETWVRARCPARVDEVRRVRRCHGNVTVPRACLDGRLDPEALFAELEARSRLATPGRKRALARSPLPR